jgi:cytochrome c oxidase subunit 5b
MECGSAYKMHYVGPAEDAHAHGHEHGRLLLFISRPFPLLTTAAENPYPRPKNMADFIKPEYAQL